MMTPAQFLEDLKVARTSITKTEKRLRDAETVARPAKEAYEAATLAYDRADGSGDPFSAAQHKEAYEKARKDHEDATARLERAQAGHAAALRELTELEVKAQQVFDAGAESLRMKALGARRELEVEWEEAASRLLEVGGRIVALERTVPSLSVKTDPASDFFAPVSFGADMLDRTIDAVIVPKLGSGGVFVTDLLVSKQRIFASIPSNPYGDFAPDYDALRRLARLFYERGVARSAAE